MIVGKEYKIDCAHFLPGHPKCGQMHGHTWTVWIEIEGQIDPETGMVMDFNDLNRHAHAILDQFDHRLINDTLTPPTVEVLCTAIWTQLRNKLSKEFFPHIWVKVKEGEGGYAIK